MSLPARLVSLLSAPVRVALSAAILLLTIGILLWLYLPDVTRLEREYPRPEFVARGQPPRIHWEKRQPPGWTRLREISSAAKWAVIVSEDWAFYQHEGIDLEQLKDSFETNWRRKRFARGASTISQQVVKNAFLSREKTLSRKLTEIILTLLMERRVPKSKILEVYFNIVEWGDGIYGIHQAAARYFRKNPRDLSAAEGAYLALLLPSPVRYSQSFRSKSLTPFAKKRIRDILDRLVQAQIITREEADAQKTLPMAFELPDTPPGAMGDGSETD